MKLGLVTKLDKKNTATSKKVGDDLMSAICEVIVIFLFYVQFVAIRKPDSGHMVCKTYIFISSKFLTYKNWKQNWTISNTALILLLLVEVLFLAKNADFFQKKSDINKIKGVLVIKVIFFKTAYVCVLTYQISSC